MHLMTTRTMLPAVLLAGAFMSNPAPAQEALKAEDQYVVLSYFKVEPENQAAYEENLSTVSKKIFAELMNQPGSNLWGWNAGRVLYRGTDEDAPTHVSASIYNGPPSGAVDTPAADAVIRKVTGMEPAAYRKRLASLRTALGSELARGIAWAGGNTPEGSFRVVSYGKLEPRRTTAYREAVISTWQPVYAAAVKEGKIVAHSVWSLVFPRGADSPYDVLSAIVYKDLPSAVRGYTGMQEDFMKVHPKKTWISAVDEARANVTTRNTVVTRVFTSTSKNVTRQ
jgi:hypothetical protein